MADFGIALAIANGGGSRITQTGISLGTPQYMSPEQATGDRSLDPRSDIYSLGAVLYEMLSGEPPHTGATSQTIIARVLTERPRSLRATRAAVPPHVDAALERALEKLPADRFATAAEFASALSVTPTIAPAFQGAASRSKGEVRRALWWGAVAGALIVGAVAGYLLGARVFQKAAPFAKEWEAEKLNGPIVALSPRISPDGQFVAFEAMEGIQTQVGVLATGSGDYKIRTHALRGYVQSPAWSPDGRIYFSRHQGGLPSVFSVLPVEGDERLVLEGAADVQVLRDNTLLFTRVNAAGVEQLYRSQPERQPVPLGALQASTSPLGFSFQPFHDGSEVVFYGRPLRDSAAVDHLYVLDLSSGAVRMLAPGLAIKNPNWRFSLAVSADDRWVLFDLPAGDLHRIVAVPRDGGNDLHVVIPLTFAPLGLDVDATGSIYVDQPIQPSEIFRYWPATGRLERSFVPNVSGVFPLPDGRYLVGRRYSTQSRVSLLSIGKSPEPFVVGTAEETSFPLTLIGRDHVALRVGSGSSTKVAIVSLATGTVVSRLANIPAAHIVSLAGAPDGRRLYYTAAGFVWQADINGSPPRRVCAGNEVAVAPDGNRLLVQRNSPKGNQLVWVHITGGAKEERILIRDTLHLMMGVDLSPNAVGTDGRIAVRVISSGSWYVPAALLDPRTGRFDVLKPGFGADASTPGWGADGSIVSMGAGIQSSLWRFRPVRQ